MGSNQSHEPTQQQHNPNVGHRQGPPPSASHAPSSEQQLQDASNHVHSIVQQFEQLLLIEVSSENFTAAKMDFELRKLDELLTQKLLQLDGIDCTRDERLRLHRKECISHIQQVLTRIDEAKRNIKRGN